MDDRSEKEAFTRPRLQRLLEGEVSGVLRGLRRMGTVQKFSGEKQKDLIRITGYLEKHQHRMRYSARRASRRGRGGRGCRGSPRR